MKNKLILIFILCMLFPLISSDMRIIITNPQATFNGDVGDIIEYSVGVKNKNNFTVNISVGDNVENINYFNDTSFLLGINETRIINYELTLVKEGNNHILIPITYKGDSESFTLHQVLKLSVKKQEVSTVEDNNSKPKSANNYVKEDKETGLYDENEEDSYAVDFVDVINTKTNHTEIISPPKDNNKVLWLSLGLLLLIVSIIIISILDTYRYNQLKGGKEK